LNYSRIVVASVAGLFVYYIYGFVVEGLLIRDHFKPYASLYRSAETVMGYMPIGMVTTFIAVLIASFVYAKGYEGGHGAAEGGRFGLLIGLFVACVFVGANYVTLNIGRRLAIELAVSNLLQWMATFVVVGIIYRPK
jgi:hypothetical protein